MGRYVSNDVAMPPTPTSIVNAASGGGTYQIIGIQDTIINAKSTLSGALTANTLVTVVSITGRGCLNYLHARGLDATGRTHRLKITLDGTVVFDATSLTTSTTAHAMIAIGAFTANYGCIPQPIYYRNSALIQYASSLSETDKTSVAYIYEVY